MRITPKQHQDIRQQILKIVGIDATVILFGSRTDDNQQGGDLDLLIELPHAIENPAWLAAKLSVKISQIMNGRNTDILLSAPNLLNLEIHKYAKSAGIVL